MTGRDDFADLFRRLLGPNHDTSATLFIDGPIESVISTGVTSEGPPIEWWNRERPDRVINAHSKYAKAGCEVLRTNTLRANRAQLKRHGLDGFVRTLNHQAVSLARAAYGENRPVKVWGCIGPLTESLSRSAAASVYHEQVDALAEAGVAGFVCEAMTRLSDALAALQCARATRLPVTVSLGIDQVGSLLDDETSAMSALLELSDDGANALGFVGFSDIVDLEALLARAKAALGVPLYVRPSAGEPVRGDSGWRYPLTPQRWAKKVLPLRQVGAQIIGGGAGAGPAHLHALWLRAVVESGRSLGD